MDSEYDDFNSLPGWKTTGFWITVLTVVASWLVAIGGIIPYEYAALASTSSTVLYTIARGIEKYAADFKRSWRTTEFYVAIINVAAMVLTSFGTDGLSQELAVLLTAIGTGVLAISRSLSAP